MSDVHWKRVRCVSYTPGLTTGSIYLPNGTELWGNNVMLVLTDDTGHERAFWAWRFEVVD